MDGYVQIALHGGLFKLKQTLLTWSIFSSNSLGGFFNVLIHILFCMTYFKTNLKQTLEKGTSWDKKGSDEGPILYTDVLLFLNINIQAESNMFCS